MIVSLTDEKTLESLLLSIKAAATYKTRSDKEHNKRGLHCRLWVNGPTVTLVESRFENDTLEVAVTGSTSHRIPTEFAIRNNKDFNSTFDVLWQDAAKRENHTIALKVLSIIDGKQG